MAFDVKGTFADTFLELCRNKDIRKITVRDLLEKTGFSRQTFYNNFKDKDDFVQYCYDTRIISEWGHIAEISFYCNLQQKR